MDAVAIKAKLQDVMRGQGSAQESIKTLAEVMLEVLEPMFTPVVIPGTAFQSVAHIPISTEPAPAEEGEAK